MPQVYSYERVSTGQQVKSGRGLERQSTSAEQWCATNGHQLDDHLRLSDAGKSAFKGAHLKGALGAFLRLAEQGQLGENPILLVEAIDRLSRLEPVDGLQDVLLALVKAGVTIVSLEDGQEYSRQTLKDDGTKLVMLALKAAAAHQYSQRLSQRMGAAWEQTRSDLEKGKLGRTSVFCPPWCELKGDQIEEIPERAEIVRTIFQRGLHDGDQALAVWLNAEKIPTLTGAERWTRSIVSKLLRDPRVWGAVRLNDQSRLSVEEREKKKAAGIVEQTFPGLLPVVVPKGEVDAVLAARSSRTKPGTASCRSGQVWNIATSLTRCSCGAAASIAQTWSNSNQRDENGDKLKLRYLRCNDRCGAPSYKLEDVNAHLLARLKVGQLQQLLANDDTGKQIKKEQKAIEKLQGQLAIATQKQETAEREFKEAIKGGDLYKHLYKDAVDECRHETESASKALANAQHRLANLRHEVNSDEFETALREMFQAFLKGEDTPELRQKLNRFLRNAGLRVTLDAQARRVGMTIGEGEPEWMELDPQTAELVLNMNGYEWKPTKQEDDTWIFALPGDFAAKKVWVEDENIFEYHLLQKQVKAKKGKTDPRLKHLRLEKSPKGKLE